MLVLSRHRDETIIIGDDIEITVVDIRGDKVRLGIQAPSQISVHRKEVYEAIKRENEQAARLTDNHISSIRTNIKARSGKASNPPVTRVSQGSQTRRESA